jgi:hypothetical protein
MTAKKTSSLIDFLNQEKLIQTPAELQAVELLLESMKSEDLEVLQSFIKAE